MANTVSLNNVAHKDIKVITRHSAGLGDDLNCISTFPTEFIDIQREYPIFFRKDKDANEFHSVALLGFAKGENLFLANGVWNASYIPDVITRGPFLIGFQEQEVEGELRKEPVIHVDLDSPRISKSEGEAIFLEHGGNSPYLERVSDSLKRIHEGVKVGPVMFSAFQEFDLLVPVSIEVDVNEAEKFKLSNFYTINQKKLAELDGEALQKLNRAGFLQCAFYVVASLRNVSKLIDIKNRERAKAQNFVK